MRVFWTSFSRSFGAALVVVAMFLGSSVFADGPGGTTTPGIVCGHWDSPSAECVRNGTTCSSGKTCVWVSYSPTNNPCECL